MHDFSYWAVGCCLLVIFCGNLLPAIAVTTPVITHVQGIVVVPATPINAVSSSITFAGTAGSGNIIGIYTAAHKVGQTSAIANGTWETTVKNLMDGSYIFSASIDDFPKISEISNPVTVAIDTSASPEPAAYMFAINCKFVSLIGERSTATTTVFISIATNDPEGVTSAKISNDGLVWETWSTPQLAPASTVWQIVDAPGIQNVYMKFYDADANESEVISQQIHYQPNYTINAGTKLDSTYPAESYDEYSGENKYGKERTSSSRPTDGNSLKLIKGF